MAKPRMFVSSTFYDLKYVRADLREFCDEFGLDAVLFERGDIAYESDRELEESCFREIGNCDLVVSIVGGRAGSRAKTNPDASICQMEVRTAHKLGKHMLFFIDKNVFAEFETFLKNENLAETINWSHVDHLAVFKFIQELKGLELNNAIFCFETSQDIILLLREQLAGLFQTLLQRRVRTKYESHVDDLIKATKTLSEIVNFLQQEKVSSQGIIREIVFTRHPLFRELQNLLHIDARVFFESLDELQKLLPYFGFVRVPEQELSDDANRRFLFWTRRAEGKREYVGLAKTLFDESGRLRPIAIDEWRDDYITNSPRNDIDARMVRAAG